MTLACREGDDLLAAYLDRYRFDGVFVPTERVRPVGERVRFRIELLDSMDYTCEAVVTAHEWSDSRFGMRLRIDSPERAIPDGGLQGLDLPPEPPPDSAVPGLAVSLAEYLCEPAETTGRSEVREDDPSGAGDEDSGIATVEPLETRFSGHWPLSVCEISMHPSVEAVEALYRTWMKNREREPMTALAAAEAMIDLGRSDPSGFLVHSVRRLTRDGHEILELALEHLENARTSEDRVEAQQLFDEALHTVVVP